VYVPRVWHVIENSSLFPIYKSSVSPGFAKQIMPILCIFELGGENRAGFIVVGILEQSKYEDPVSDNKFRLLQYFLNAYSN
jgi:hypothetical protein